MAGHEIPQSEARPIAEQSAGQPSGLSRRTFLRRTGEVAVAAGTAAVAHQLWLPHEALGAQRPTLEEPAALTADGRIAEARREIARLERKHPSRLPNITARAEAVGGSDYITPGSIFYSHNTPYKLLTARFDDGWDEALVAEAFATFRNLGVKVNVFPVGPSVQAYAGEYRKADATKLIEWGNHTMTHPDLTPFSRDAIIDDELMPQSNALRTVLRRGVEELMIGTPYGAGTSEGQRDAEIVSAAKKLKMGLAMWNKDGMGWNGATVDEIMDRLLPIRRGDNPIFHFLRNDIDAFKLYVKEAKRKGFDFIFYSQIGNAKGMGL